MSKKEEILELLSAIPDPEIPALTIAEIGMLKDVVLTGNGCEVILTPTYTGCPAMGYIEREITRKLAENNVLHARVRLVFDPAWTTDHMSGAAKEKLRQYGIAPPLHTSCNNENFAINEIACPRCRSCDTALLSRFGSTPCKALYKCNDCKEPFEYFKCL